MRIPRSQHSTHKLHDSYKSKLVGLIAGDNKAAHDVAMAAQIFGGAMYGKICPLFERLAQVGGGEGVIHNQLRPGGVGNLGAGDDVTYLQQGIGDGLSHQNPRLGAAGGFPQVLEVREISGHGIDSERTKHIEEQVKGRAVEVLRGQYSCPRRQLTGKDGGMQGGHARGISAGEGALFELLD